MRDLIDLLKYFSGVNSWLALGGIGLFVFLALFRTAAQDLIKNLKVPARKAAGIVHMFMLLVALVVLVTLTFAFLDARETRDHERRERAEADFQRQIEQRRANWAQCIQSAEESAVFVKPFDSEASVRCPGGGCAPWDGNCNKRETLLSYSAPGDYFIEAYGVERGAMNDGNIGQVTVTAQDGTGRAVSIRAVLWCDPSDRPGAGGGWANAKFVGSLRLRDEAARKAAIREECTARHPEPVRASWEHGPAAVQAGSLLGLATAPGGLILAGGGLLAGVVIAGLLRRLLR